jgi:stage II sporulation protein D
VADLLAVLPADVRARAGKLAAVQVAETDASGRVRRVQLVGDAGQSDVTGADLRRWIGSTRLRSTLFTVRLDAKDGGGVVTFDGRGNGHGHGMCQAGAIGMASAPYRAAYSDILQHYFPGSRLVCLAALEASSSGGNRH